MSNRKTVQDHSENNRPVSAEEQQQRIDAALDYCRQQQVDQLIMALPYPTSEDVLLKRLNSTMPAIRGFLCDYGTSSKDIVRFRPEEDSWQMPAHCATTLISLGPRYHFNYGMISKARNHGVKQLIYTTPEGFQQENVERFLIRRFIGNIGRALLAIPLCGWRALVVIASTCYQRWLIEPLNACYQRHFAATCQPVIDRYQARRKQRREQLERENALTLYRNELTLQFKALTAEPLLEAGDFIPGRIVVVNTSLYHGGAERQILNTMFGLIKRGYDDIIFLCDSLDSSKEHDFYLWRLKDGPIRVQVIRREPSEFSSDELNSELIEQVKARFAPHKLPYTLDDDIPPFVHELLVYRPEILYAWQDGTNVKAGIAAAMVGVPKIFFSTRNMAADNFPHYYHEWFKPGYAVLTKRSNVTIINNSYAGTADYERWLSLNKGQIKVLHNGFEEDSIPKISPTEAAAYRQELGLPEDVPVVGGIFRFDPEKDPLLWIRTAKVVCDHHPTVVFLLIGGGRMTREINNLIRIYDLADRIFIPGTVTNPALPLALFDLLLLTSKQEGIPNVVIEAQWVGVPVVATEAGGTRDAMEVGETGWMVDLRDHYILAERILFVLNDNEWREQARKKSPAITEHRFNIDRMVDETLQIFDMPLKQE